MKVQKIIFSDIKKKKKSFNNEKKNVKQINYPIKFLRSVLVSENLPNIFQNLENAMCDRYIFLNEKGLSVHASFLILNSIKTMK